MKYLLGIQNFKTICQTAVGMMVSMKPMILLILCFFAFWNEVQAQELTVKSMKASPMDLSASQYDRKDLEGQACGLVKVELADEGAKIEGNVYGKVEYKTGEYWVYMTQGSYMLRIKHPKFVPLDVNFRDYGISGVEGKITYTLTLLMGVKTQKLIIDYTPKDAMVLVDSKPYQRNGHLELMLPVGPHDYVIAKEGYTTIEGVAKLNKDNIRRITESLQPEKSSETDQMPAKQQNSQVPVPNKQEQLASKPEVQTTQPQISQSDSQPESQVVSQAADSEVPVSSQTLTKDQLKIIKKQAKEFQKEGWIVNLDSPSLADQIARTTQAQMEKDAEGNFKWLVGESRAVGYNYDAARSQALTVVQGEISRQFRTDFASQIEQYLVKADFGQSETESITKTIVTQMSGRFDKIANRPRILMDCYRKLPNGNYEVMIRAAIPSKTVNSLIEEVKGLYFRRK